MLSLNFTKFQSIYPQIYIKTPIMSKQHLYIRIAQAYSRLKKLNLLSIMRLTKIYPMLIKKRAYQSQNKCIQQTSTDLRVKDGSLTRLCEFRLFSHRAKGSELNALFYCIKFRREKNHTLGSVLSVAASSLNILSFVDIAQIMSHVFLSIFNS